MTMRLAALGLLAAAAAWADFPALYAPGCAKDAVALREARRFGSQCLAALDLPGRSKALLARRGERLYLGIVKPGLRAVWTAALERKPAGTAIGGALFVGAVGDRIVFRDEVASVAAPGTGPCGAGSESYVTIARVQGRRPGVELRLPVESCLQTMELASVAEPVRMDGERLLIEWFQNGEGCEEERSYDLRAASLTAGRKTRNCAK